MMGEITEIGGGSERRVLRFRASPLYAGQWDGSRGGAQAIAQDLVDIAETLGASVLQARRTFWSVEGAWRMTLEVQRHDDDHVWRTSVRERQWLVLWRNEGRLVDIEVLDADIGDARFAHIAPVIVLRGPAPEIEGD